MTGIRTKSQTMNPNTAVVCQKALSESKGMMAALANENTRPRTELLDPIDVSFVDPDAANRLPAQPHPG